MQRVAVTEAMAQADHDVKSGQLPVPGTKRFSQQALHSIAIHGQSLDFARDNQSQSGVRKIIGFSKDLEKFAACRTPESNNRGEFFCFAQAVSFWKANSETPR
jgi:hypothetical protein